MVNKTKTTKKTKNALVKSVSKSGILKELNKELQEEYKSAIKEKAKTLMKNIKRTEIILEQQKKELEDLLSGKKVVTEAQILFE